MVNDTQTLASPYILATGHLIPFYLRNLPFFLFVPGAHETRELLGQTFHYDICKVVQKIPGMVQYEKIHPILTGFPRAQCRKVKTCLPPPRKCLGALWPKADVTFLLDV